MTQIEQILQCSEQLWSWKVPLPAQASLLNRPTLTTLTPKGTICSPFKVYLLTIKDLLNTKV